MRRCLLIWYCFSLYCLSANAAAVEINHSCFQLGTQSYIELHFWLASNSLAYQQVDSLAYQTKMEVTILFFRQENATDSVLQRFDKYVLNGPLTAIPVDFRDVKRYQLAPGDYVYHIAIKDLLQDKEPYHFRKSFQLEHSVGSLGQSDLQLLHQAHPSTDTASAFVKNGIMMEPILGQLYGQASTQLICYHEIYNAVARAGGALNLRYFILNDRKKEIRIRHKALNTRALYPLLLTMDIRALASGRYSFVVEIRDEQNQLLSSRQVPFYRVNPHLNITREQISDEQLTTGFIAQLGTDTLRYLLKAIATVSESPQVAELNQIIARRDLAEQRRYLLAYFLNKNPQYPARACRRFFELAGAVDKRFGSGLGYGFETDRGLIYMRYGAPDDLINIENEPDAPPYEIWIYYDFPQTRQTHVKFLFYNPNLTVGAYDLLHSTALSERQNRQWALELYRKVPDAVEGQNYFDATRVKSGINRRAMEYFADY